MRSFLTNLLIFVVLATGYAFLLDKATTHSPVMAKVGRMEPQRAEIGAVPGLAEPTDQGRTEKPITSPFDPIPGSEEVE